MTDEKRSVEHGVYSTIGPPGTGKTTYLARKVRDFVEWSMGHNPDRWQSDILLCSLTRAAAAEIAGRDLPLPKQQVGTLHAHAFRALGCPDIAEGHLADFNRLHPAYAISNSNGTVDDPTWDRDVCQRGDELAQDYSLLRARKTQREAWPNRVAAFAEVWEQWKRDALLTDFADLIDNAFTETACAPGAPSIICVDEAQDCSRAEHDLVRKWGLAAGHLIMTGDPDQSIYGWRGAEPDELYSDRILPEHRRVLGQSYRVPRAVHRVAMKWRERLQAPHALEYMPRDADGSACWCPASYRTPDMAVQLAERRLAEGKTVMFVASCGYLLVPTLGALRARAIPFSNPWRRRRGDWNPLAQKAGTSMVDRITALLAILPSESNRMWTWDEVERWSAPMDAKLMFQPKLRKEFERLAAETPDDQTSWEQLKDLMQPDALHAFVNHLVKTSEPGCDVQRVVRDILDWWRTKLNARKVKTSEFPIAIVGKHGLAAAREEPRLYIGTAHSLKGAEADTVILYPDLSPAGAAEWQSPLTRDAVVRLFYVAATRAREELIVCRACGAHAPVASCLEN